MRPGWCLVRPASFDGGAAIRGREERDRRATDRDGEVVGTGVAGNEGQRPGLQFRQFQKGKMTRSDLHPGSIFHGRLDVQGELAFRAVTGEDDPAIKLLDNLVGEPRPTGQRASA